jgi:hypothetical protein
VRNAISPAAAALGLGLGAWGAWLDRAQPLPQAGLWAALQLASLCGAVLGALLWRRRFQRPAAILGLACALLLGWRVSYFPIMVFSGHVASIAEWLEIAVGLPVFVYPIFLVAVATLHTVAGLGVAFLLRPPHKLVYAVLVPAFAVATAVSFSDARDLAPLPDRAWRLAAAVPPVVEPRANPYLAALGDPAYRLHVNVMLLAAGLTYETIPPSPWARTVMAVLEHAFNENPVASTQDRVVEHYLAYHSAHDRIGCRDLAECPAAGVP